MPLQCIHRNYEINRNIVNANIHHLHKAPSLVSILLQNYEHHPSNQLIKTSFKMPDKDASTPRLFLIRHGETEWSMSGKHTGKTEIPLTPHGETQVAGTAAIAVGAGKLVDPAKLAKVFVSPRGRAQKTAELLFGAEKVEDLKEKGVYETEDLAQEWDYG